MITKRLSLSVIVWMCVFVANPTQADLSFGPNVIVKGNTIEVVGPGPDLQSIIDGITDESASIIGSGEHATILKGAISTASQSGESAIIAAANPATLADLKVFNTWKRCFNWHIQYERQSPHPAKPLSKTVST